MTFASMGSLVYLIFALINCLSLSPVTGAKYADYTVAISKADGENAAIDLAETEITFFSFTVSEVFGYDTAGVSEGILCQRKRYSMFFLVFSVLVRIPLKPSFFHKISLAWRCINFHIIIWLSSGLVVNLKRGGKGRCFAPYRSNTGLGQISIVMLRI